MAIATPPVQQADPPTKPPAAAGLGGARRAHPWRWVVVLSLIAAGVFWGAPRLARSLRTVSTDDAFVNGRVSLAAARVPGQISRVLVEDNNRVRKGDLLAQLDDAPYRAVVNIRQASVDAAGADVAAADAKVRASQAQARAARFRLEHAVEDVDNQVALLKSKIATLRARQANASKAKADLERGAPLVTSGAISSEDLDRRKEALQVADAQVEQSLQEVYQVRVLLGLPARPESGELAEVPSDLSQSFSTVREAQAELIRAASEFGVTTSSWSASPREMIAEFYRRDPDGNIDRIYEKLREQAPAMLQARARLVQAQRDLEQAQLDLSYCDIRSEIDGVIARREAYPGNNVVVGQALMTIRSLTDIWVDANFKETQLVDLRIGQPVDIETDMYGTRRTFSGRVSGFTMGTGSTLALLPPENATGNFVKVVQRLPVRIELIGYNPDEYPLFTGLSVTPRVDIRATPAGENAGRVLAPPVPERDPGAPAPEPKR